MKERIVTSHSPPEEDPRIELLMREYARLSARVEVLVEHIKEKEKEKEQEKEQEESPEAALPQPKEEKKPAKKSRRDIIINVTFYGILVLMIVGALFVRSTGSGVPISFAGYTAQIVLTGSMEDVIPKGSLVIAKKVDPKTLQIGDDITYMANPTTTITHRIVGITERYDATGQRAFQTQGTMNEAADNMPVPAANVIGKVIYHNVPLGKVADFIRRNWPLLLFLLLLLAAFTKVMQKILRGTT